MAMLPSTVDNLEFSDPSDPFKQEAARLARRRQLARSLIEQGSAPNTGGGYNGGKVFMVGSPLGNVASALAGQYVQGQTDDASKELQQRMQGAQADWQQQYQAAPDDQTRQQLLVDARNKGLRYDLEQQFQKEEAARIERGEQLAADRVTKAQQAEAERIDRGEQKAADRVAREELRQMPSVVVHSGGGGGRAAGGIKAPSGYRYNDDGTALEPIPGGPADRSGAGAKPMSASQEKAALELGAEFATVNRLASTFKPEYAGDTRSSIQREFGKTFGGAAPEKTQKMTAWWSEQDMMDSLPKRHELFGAALTPTETKSWNAATITPSMSPDKIKERLAVRQKIMTDTAARMQGSVVAGGRSGRQFEAASGMRPGASGGWDAKPAQPGAPVRRKYNPATGDFE